MYQHSGLNQGMKAAFSGLSIGTKIKCFDGQGAIPAVSVLADFSVPATASKGFSVDHLAPSLYLLFENPLNDKFSLGLNWMVGKKVQLDLAANMEPYKSCTELVYQLRCSMAD